VCTIFQRVKGEKIHIVPPVASAVLPAGVHPAAQGDAGDAPNGPDRPGAAEAPPNATGEV
jgi:hypothetical protein